MTAIAATPREWQPLNPRDVNLKLTLHMRGGALNNRRWDQTPYLPAVPWIATQDSWLKLSGGVPFIAELPGMERLPLVCPPPAWIETED